MQEEEQSSAWRRGNDELTLGCASLKYQWRQTLPEEQLIRCVWSGDGRTGRHQYSWAQGSGRVMGEDKVIQGEYAVGEGRGPGMKPAENWPFRDWAGKGA